MTPTTKRETNTALARRLCGCAENVQGGCPRPSKNCLERALRWRLTYGREQSMASDDQTTDNSLWKTCPDKSRARADAEWTIGEAEAFRAGAEAMRARAAHEVSGAFLSDGMPPLERWARMEQSLDAYRRIAALPIPEPGE